MRIAQIAPLHESVPPVAYGGTERVVSYLSEELVKQGHEVTLFASGDSHTKARLVACSPRALRLDETVQDVLAPQILQLETVLKEADRFDVLHFHTDYSHYPISRRLNYNHVTTLHGRLDLPELQGVYREYDDMPVVSISDSQRTPVPGAHWLGTVYHGLPPDLFTASVKPSEERYFLFLGRISPEKRPDRAIDLCQKLRVTLKIAAKVDAHDQAYFDECIKPRLNEPYVEFLGEVNGRPKNELMSNATGLIFLIDWPEPFGLVMIEALACGTPVIAWCHGSVPEIIEDKVSGYLVNSMEEAFSAASMIERLDRRTCRSVFEKRFSAARMAGDYLKIYEQLLFTKKREVRKIG